MALVKFGNLDGQEQSAKLIANSQPCFLTLLESPLAIDRLHWEVQYSCRACCRVL